MQTSKPRSGGSRPTTSLLLRAVASSIGSKWIVALTGLVLAGFVIVHMAGNLQVFLGPDALNAYAAKLKGLPALLWIARIALLLAVLVHIGIALRLAVRNLVARPQRYRASGTVQATLSSRTMVFTGPMIAAFVLYHLLHFTFGAIYPDAYHRTDPQGRHDVYTMTVLGFRNVWIALSYVVAMVFLGLHLRHGVSSLFQTVGVRHPKLGRVGLLAGPALASIVAFGNVSIPVAALTGALPLPSWYTP